MKKIQQCNLRSITVLLVIGLTFLGCRNDDDNGPPHAPADAGCEPIPAYIFNGHHTELNDSLSVRSAVAAPDDPNTYIFFYNPPNVTAMFRADMADSSLQQIIEFGHFDRMRWVSGDTILGIRNESRVRLFTTDGSFEQDHGLASNANVGPIPGRFIYLREFNFAPPLTLLGHFDGTAPDTLAQVLTGDLAWPSVDTVFSGGVVYAISSNELQTIVETEGPTYLSVIDAHTYLLSDAHGLYLVDVSSLSYTTLVEFVNCEVLSHPQYHHATGRILATRTHRYMIPHSTVIINRSEIVWLNMQGEVEEVVNMVPLIYPE